MRYKRADYIHAFFRAAAIAWPCVVVLVWTGTLDGPVRYVGCDWDHHGLWGVETWNSAIALTSGRLRKSGDRVDEICSIDQVAIDDCTMLWVGICRSPRKYTQFPMTYWRGVFPYGSWYWRGFGYNACPAGLPQPIMFRVIQVPIWFFLLVTEGLILAALFGRFDQRIRKGYRAKHGMCIQCGYDLRASPERCPECGWVRSSIL